jgi:hypothetical protein
MLFIPFVGALPLVACGKADAGAAPASTTAVTTTAKAATPRSPVVIIHGE